jgi:hypothetical protein
VRRAGKTDSNQKPVVALLRSLGCRVRVTSGVGEGFPDCVARTPRGTVFLVEVKDGDEPLTPLELLFQADWGDAYVVVRSDHDARRLAAL